MDKRSLIFVAILALAFYLVQEFFPSSKPKVIKPIEKVAPLVNEPALKEEISPSKISDEETYYVIENSYQQLVFSTKGGALVEINLPFKSKTNDKSVINEIAFDKDLEEQSPPNAYFPLHSYSTVKDGKTVKMEKGKFGGYYPLIRRDLIDTKEKVSPTYYALTLADGEMENQIFTLSKIDATSIEFVLKSYNRTITKTFTLSDDSPYMISMDLQIDGNVKNMYLTSGVPEVELTSGNYEPILKLKLTKKDKGIIEKISLPKTTSSVSSIYPDWLCNSNGFFGLIIDPVSEASQGYKASFVDGTKLPTRLSLIDAKYKLYPSDKYPGYELFVPIKSTAEKIHFRVFAGPFAKDILVALDDIYSKPLEGYDPAYVKAISFHGWFSFISEPFAKFMFGIMNMMYKLTHSWGFSIILLTILLRLMLYPLNAWSIKSNLKMQEVGPKVQALQKKYEKNPQKARIEVMNLYREKGVNPMMGCFPILIQMPFLIGMFDLLRSTFELRGASFIPGWIDNLTAPDVLFSWNQPLFFIGNQFHLLPVLLAVVMFVQQKFSSTMPKDKSLMTDQQRQMTAMNNIMTIVFTVMFYKLPSGLNIYWLFSMVFGILQQWIMNKTLLKKTNARVE
ncbi:MAG: membrane protein insertase YidC [Chlamydiae bacterium]|nr:membrane protein insertase YidC [Chlamydiota bacterium]